MKRPDPAYWSPFWRNPTITSFGNLFPSNYDGVMLDFWRRQITADLQHVLDVACGNGALTWIAHDLLRDSSPGTRITGVDLAAIDPFGVLGRDPQKYPGVRFISSTPAERLPFADAAADLVISQYGIEYSDLEKSVPEVARVLGPTGRMAFILHDKESVIVKGATQHLDDFRRVCEEIRLHDLCLEFDQLLRSDRNFKRLSATPAYRALDGRIAESLYLVRRIVREHPPTSPVVRYLDLLVRALQMTASKDSDQRRRLIIEAATGLRSHVERVDDLWLAARSAVERERLVELVRSQGFSVTESEVLRYKDGDNFGTTFAARRA